MAEQPSLKQILEIYYALRAAGVQRFPKPLVASGQTVARSAECLFLIDFVSALEKSQLQSDGGAVPGILRRLLDRLPWREGVVVHSIFDSQPKSPQLHPIPEDVVSQVLGALERSNAHRCVCFGWRAAQVCAVAFGIPFALPAESFEPLVFPVEGRGDFELLVLPDVRELEAFPDWRARVWESLLAFGPAR